MNHRMLTEGDQISFHSASNSSSDENDEFNPDILFARITELENLIPKGKLTHETMNEILDLYQVFK